MTLRVAKFVLVSGLAFYYTLVVLNNLTDYDSNYQFVRHVLTMDSTFPGNHLMWRSIHSPAMNTAFYSFLINWECVVMALHSLSASMMLQRYRVICREFSA